ncbi:hypothetical protein L2E82_10670 [Cichorium intybus]|uniref:Uncharacterized protein n=1 Tax=Cichorium intybus TaxID=13427 RepID=A0ACB9GB15_CICIN|nr:hypothetical protein L2E82_10670 [Cichorium intybus]
MNYASVCYGYVISFVLLLNVAVVIIETCTKVVDACTKIFGGIVNTGNPDLPSTDLADSDYPLSFATILYVHVSRIKESKIKAKGAHVLVGLEKHHRSHDANEVFSEINELPEVNLERKDKEFKTLVEWSHNLTTYWNSSPYYLEDPSKDSKKNENTTKRPPVSDYMILSSDLLPSELVGKNSRHIKRKKTQWDLQSDLLKLDIFEKLDQAGQGCHNP